MPCRLREISHLTYDALRFRNLPYFCEMSGTADQDSHPPRERATATHDSATLRPDSGCTPLGNRITIGDATIMAIKLRGLRWWMIALLTLGTVMNYLARSSLSVAAPTVMQDLHISTAQYGWI